MKNISPRDEDVPLCACNGVVNLESREEQFRFEKECNGKPNKENPMKVKFRSRKLKKKCKYTHASNEILRYLKVSIQNQEENLRMLSNIIRKQDENLQMKSEKVSRKRQHENVKAQWVRLANILDIISFWILLVVFASSLVMLYIGYKIYN